MASQKEEQIVGWAGLYCSLTQAVNMKELILLDSDSTNTVFCTPKYESNVRDSEEPLIISTNERANEITPEVQYSINQRHVV